MEVILLEKIYKLGDLGDTVRVRPGYGRNFLIPKGKALPATDTNRKVFEERKAELITRAEESLGAARLRAEALDGLTLTIEARSLDQGKLYGSVGPAEIAAAAAEQGIELERSEIDLPEGPIRVLGEYQVRVQLHSEVEREIAVHVVEAAA